MVWSGKPNGYDHGPHHSKIRQADPNTQVRDDMAMRRSLPSDRAPLGTIPDVRRGLPSDRAPLGAIPDRSADTLTQVNQGIRGFLEPLPQKAGKNAFSHDAMSMRSGQLSEMAPLKPIEDRSRNPLTKVNRVGMHERGSNKPLAQMAGKHTDTGDAMPMMSRQMQLAPLVPIQNRSVNPSRKVNNKGIHDSGFCGPSLDKEDTTSLYQEFLAMNKIKLSDKNPPGALENASQNPLSTASREYVPDDGVYETPTQMTNPNAHVRNSVERSLPFFKAARRPMEDRPTNNFSQANGEGMCDYGFYEKSKQKRDANALSRDVMAIAKGLSCERASLGATEEEMVAKLNKAATCDNNICGPLFETSDTETHSPDFLTIKRGYPSKQAPLSDITKPNTIKAITKPNSQDVSDRSFFEQDCSAKPKKMATCDSTFSEPPCEASDPETHSCDLLAIKRGLPPKIAPLGSIKQFSTKESITKPNNQNVSDRSFFDVFLRKDVPKCDAEMGSKSAATGALAIQKQFVSQSETSEDPRIDTLAPKVHETDGCEEMRQTKLHGSSKSDEIAMDKSYDTGTKLGSANALSRDAMAMTKGLPLEKVKVCTKKKAKKSAKLKKMAKCDNNFSEPPCEASDPETHSCDFLAIKRGLPSKIAPLGSITKRNAVDAITTPNNQNISDRSFFEVFLKKDVPKCDTKMDSKSSATDALAIQKQFVSQSEKLKYSRIDTLATKVLETDDCDEIRTNRVHRQSNSDEVVDGTTLENSYSNDKDEAITSCNDSTENSDGMDIRDICAGGRRQGPNCSMSNDFIDRASSSAEESYAYDEDGRRASYGRSTESSNVDIRDICAGGRRQGPNCSMSNDFIDRASSSAEESYAYDEDGRRASYGRSTESSNVDIRDICAGGRRQGPNCSMSNDFIDRASSSAEESYAYDEDGRRASYGRSTESSNVDIRDICAGGRRQGPNCSMSNDFIDRASSSAEESYAYDEDGRRASYGGSTERSNVVAKDSESDDYEAIHGICNGLIANVLGTEAYEEIHKICEDRRHNKMPGPSTSDEFADKSSVETKMFTVKTKTDSDADTLSINSDIFSEKANDESDADIQRIQSEVFSEKANNTNESTNSNKVVANLTTPLNMPPNNVYDTILGSAECLTDTFLDDNECKSDSESKEMVHHELGKDSPPANGDVLIASNKEHSQSEFALKSANMSNSKSLDAPMSVCQGGDSSVTDKSAVDLIIRTWLERTCKETADKDAELYCQPENKMHVNEDDSLRPVDKLIDADSCQTENRDTGDSSHDNKDVTSQLQERHVQGIIHQRDVEQSKVIIDGTSNHDFSRKAMENRASDASDSDTQAIQSKADRESEEDTLSIINSDICSEKSNDACDADTQPIQSDVFSEITNNKIDADCLSIHSDNLSVKTNDESIADAQAFQMFTVKTNDQHVAGAKETQRVILTNKPINASVADDQAVQREHLKNKTNDDDIEESTNSNKVVANLTTPLNMPPNNVYDTILGSAECLTDTFLDDNECKSDSESKEMVHHELGKDSPPANGDALIASDKEHSQCELALKSANMSNSKSLDAPMSVCHGGDSSVTDKSAVDLIIKPQLERTCKETADKDAALYCQPENKMHINGEDTSRPVDKLTDAASCQTENMSTGDAHHDNEGVTSQLQEHHVQGSIHQRDVEEYKVNIDGPSNHDCSRKAMENEVTKNRAGDASDSDTQAIQSKADIQFDEDTLSIINSDIFSEISNDACDADTQSIQSDVFSEKANNTIDASEEISGTKASDDESANSNKVVANLTTPLNMPTNNVYDTILGSAECLTDTFLDDSECKSDSESKEMVHHELGKDSPPANGDALIASDKEHSQNEFALKSANMSNSKSLDASMSVCHGGDSSVTDNSAVDLIIRTQFERTCKETAGKDAELYCQPENEMHINGDDTSRPVDKLTDAASCQTENRSTGDAHHDNKDVTPQLQVRHVQGSIHQRDVEESKVNIDGPSNHDCSRKAMENEVTKNRAGDASDSDTQAVQSKADIQFDEDTLSIINSDIFSEISNDACDADTQSIQSDVFSERTNKKIDADCPSIHSDNLSVKTNDESVADAQAFQMFTEKTNDQNIAGAKETQSVILTNKPINASVADDQAVQREHLKNTSNDDDIEESTNSNKVVANLTTPLNMPPNNVYDTILGSAECLTDIFLDDNECKSDSESKEMVHHELGKDCPPANGDALIASNKEHSQCELALKSANMSNSKSLDAPMSVCQGGDSSVTDNSAVDLIIRTQLERTCKETADKDAALYCQPENKMHINGEDTSRPVDKLTDAASCQTENRYTGDAHHDNEDVTSQLQEHHVQGSIHQRDVEESKVNIDGPSNHDCSRKAMENEVTKNRAGDASDSDTQAIQSKADIESDEDTLSIINSDIFSEKLNDACDADTQSIQSDVFSERTNNKIDADFPSIHSDNLSVKTNDEHVADAQAIQMFTVKTNDQNIAGAKETQSVILTNKPINASVADDQAVQREHLKNTTNDDDIAEAKDIQSNMFKDKTYTANCSDTKEIQNKVLTDQTSSDIDVDARTIQRKRKRITRKASNELVASAKEIQRELFSDKSNYESNTESLSIQSEICLDISSDDSTTYGIFMPSDTVSDKSSDDSTTYGIFSEKTNTKSFVDTKANRGKIFRDKTNDKSVVRAKEIQSRKLGENTTSDNVTHIKATKRKIIPEKTHIKSVFGNQDIQSKMLTEKINAIHDKVVKQKIFAVTTNCKRLAGVKEIQGKIATDNVNALTSKTFTDTTNELRIDGMKDVLGKISTYTAITNVIDEPATEVLGKILTYTAITNIIDEPATEVKEMRCKRVTERANATKSKTFTDSTNDKCIDGAKDVLGKITTYKAITNVIDEPATEVKEMRGKRVMERANATKSKTFTDTTNVKSIAREKDVVGKILTYRAITNVIDEPATESNKFTYNINKERVDRAKAIPKKILTDKPNYECFADDKEIKIKILPEKTTTGSATNVQEVKRELFTNKASNARFTNAKETRSKIFTGKTIARSIAVAQEVESEKITDKAIRSKTFTGKTNNRSISDTQEIKSNVTTDKTNRKNVADAKETQGKIFTEKTIHESAPDDYEMQSKITNGNSADTQEFQSKNIPDKANHEHIANTHANRSEILTGEIDIRNITDAQVIQSNIVTTNNESEANAQAALLKISAKLVSDESNTGTESIKTKLFTNKANSKTIAEKNPTLSAGHSPINNKQISNKSMNETNEDKEINMSVGQVLTKHDYMARGECSSGDGIHTQRIVTQEQSQITNKAMPRNETNKTFEKQQEMVVQAEQTLTRLIYTNKDKQNSDYRDDMHSLDTADEVLASHTPATSYRGIVERQSNRNVITASIQTQTDTLRNDQVRRRGGFAKTSVLTSEVACKKNVCHASNATSYRSNVERQSNRKMMTSSMQTQTDTLRKDQVRRRGGFAKTSVLTREVACQKNVCLASNALKRNVMGAVIENKTTSCTKSNGNAKGVITKNTKTAKINGNAKGVVTENKKTTGTGVGTIMAVATLVDSVSKLMHTEPTSASNNAATANIKETHFKIIEANKDKCKAECNANQPPNNDVTNTVQSKNNIYRKTHKDAGISSGRSTQTNPISVNDGSKQQSHSSASYVDREKDVNYLHNLKYINTPRPPHRSLSEQHNARIVHQLVGKRDGHCDKNRDAPSGSRQHEDLVVEALCDRHRDAPSGSRQHEDLAVEALCDRHRDAPSGSRQHEDLAVEALCDKHRDALSGSRHHKDKAVETNRTMHEDHQRTRSARHSNSDLPCDKYIEFDLPMEPEQPRRMAWMEKHNTEKGKQKKSESCKLYRIDTLPGDDNEEAKTGCFGCCGRKTKNRNNSSKISRGNKVMQFFRRVKACFV